MEERLHRYELDLDTLMAELDAVLQDHGYGVEHVEGGVWRFQTHWGRGAAYGEIGSLFYNLVARLLREVDGSG